MSISEFDVITSCFSGLTPPREDVHVPIGDDAAVVSLPENHQLVMSMDTLVSGVHFHADAEPEDIGYKAVAVNLSDMAAMGAKPLWVTLALTLPNTDSDWLRKFCTGLQSLLQQHNVALIGGDLTHGPLSITIQVHGCCEPNRVLRRDVAQENDNIYVTGQLGAAGYALLNRDYDNFLMRPTPRIEVGRALVDYAHACIDISDGLLADCGHILRASKQGAYLNVEQLPIHSIVRKHCEASQATELALTAGDDYELCFTAPKKHHMAILQLCQQLDCECTLIGEVISGEGIKCINAQGDAIHFTKTGYKHFHEDTN